MRWVIGDVHGCARELEQLVERIRYDAARDELWSVGDLVNTGPDSLAVLRLWRELGGRAVLGNHDVYALRAFAGTGRRHPDRLDALFAAPDGAGLLDALRAESLLAYLPGDGDRVRDTWIVHAGVHPRWTDLAAVAAAVEPLPHDEAWLARDEVAFATRARCCTPDGAMVRSPGPPADCPDGYRPWDEYWPGPRLVVHGHWAQRGFYRGEHTLGLDSGCVYGGALTAWCQEEDRVVQVRSGTSVL